MSANRALSTCWIVTDGKAGMESQCLGLAEALGLDPIIKRVKLRPPWRQLSPYLRLGHRHAFTHGSDALAPPWPDLLIATGRHSVAASLYIRQESRRRGQPTITVQIQDPVIAPSNFDLVIVPEHDRLQGVNVVQTAGALHRVTPGKLRDAAAKLAANLKDLPQPYIGVLIGGANAAYRFGEDEMRHLSAALVRTARETGGSLLVTPSRRTGERNMELLKAALTDMPVFIWNGQGGNPYFGILGLSDQLIVTSDSVNMVSEAAATGKPVHVFDLPGGSAKFMRFHEAMRKRGLTQPYNGALAQHHRVPADDDMARAAEAVHRLVAR